VTSPARKGDDLQQAMVFAELLAATLNKHGLRARAWGKQGTGARVYIGRSFLSVSRGGDVSDRSRGAATLLESDLYPRERAAYRSAREEYRELQAGQFRGNPLFDWRTPPEGRWWAKHPKADQPCYPTKSAALAKFLDTNYEIVEHYGGADYKVGTSEFDAVNRKHGAKARTIAEAAWAAMPAGKPFCLDRIDLEALNATSPAREAGVPFRLPDVVHEAKIADEEAKHYGQEPDLGSSEPAEAELPEPDWVSEHEDDGRMKASDCFLVGDHVSFLDDEGKRREGEIVKITKRHIVVDDGDFEWGVSPGHLVRTRPR
jgi:hypothetical protein